MNEIWILGATGRAGRAIAAQLAARHASPVLVGRDPTRLSELAGTIGGNPRIVAAGSVDAVVTELAQSTPAMVINNRPAATASSCSPSRAVMAKSSFARST